VRAAPGARLGELEGGPFGSGEDLRLPLRPRYRSRSRWSGGPAELECQATRQPHIPVRCFVELVRADTTREGAAPWAPDPGQTLLLQAGADPIRAW